MLQYVHIDISVTVPGIDKPFKLDQWVPIQVPDAIPSPTPTETVSGVQIVLPGFVSPKRPSVLSINGARRTVAACVCAALAQVRDGKHELRLRPEVLFKIERDLPELLPFLHRNADRKVTAKAAVYTISNVHVQ